MENKCIYRLKLEKLLDENRPIASKYEKCEDCTGQEELKYKCPDYIDINHILNFYEMFKQQ